MNTLKKYKILKINLHDDIILTFLSKRNQKNMDIIEANTLKVSNTPKQQQLENIYECDDKRRHK